MRGLAESPRRGGSYQRPHPARELGPQMCCAREQGPWRGLGERFWRRRVGGWQRGGMLATCWLGSLTAPRRPCPQNCMFDTCNCEKSEACMCAALSSYVRACAAKGVLLSDWRDGVCGECAGSLRPMGPGADAHGPSSPLWAQRPRRIQANEGGPGGDGGARRACGDGCWLCPESCPLPGILQRSPQPPAPSR